MIVGRGWKGTCQWLWMWLSRYKEKCNLASASWCSDSLAQLFSVYLLILFARLPCSFLPWFCSSEWYIPCSQFGYASPEGKIAPSYANLRSVYHALFLQQKHVQNRKNRVCNKPKNNIKVFCLNSSNWLGQKARRCTSLPTLICEQFLYLLG